MQGRVKYRTQLQAAWARLQVLLGSTQVRNESKKLCISEDDQYREVNRNTLYYAEQLRYRLKIWNSLSVFYVSLKTSTDRRSNWNKDAVFFKLFFPWSLYILCHVRELRSKAFWRSVSAWLSAFTAGGQTAKCTSKVFIRLKLGPSNHRTVWSTKQIPKSQFSRAVNPAPLKLLTDSSCIYREWRRRTKLLINEKPRSGPGLLCEIQTKQSVHLGFTEVTYQKNQCLILSMQVLGKSSSEYTFLYNSTGVF